MKNKIVKRMLISSTMLMATIALASCGGDKTTKSYVVKFDSNDPDKTDTKQPSAFNDIVVESGSTIDLTKYEPTYDGWQFDGWYSDSSLQTKYNGEAITANIKLYAKWVDTIVITFNTNGGSSIASQTIASNSTATKPTDPTKDAKSNGDHTECAYIFEGWYTNETLTKKFDFATTLESNTTLYAKYNERIQAEDGYSMSSSSLDISTKNTCAVGSVPTDTIDGVWTLSNDGSKNEISARNRTWNLSTESSVEYLTEDRVTGVISVEENSRKTITNESTKSFSKAYVLGAGKKISSSLNTYDSSASLNVTIADDGYIVIYAELSAGLGIINTSDGSHAEIKSGTAVEKVVIQYVFKVSAGTYKFYRTSGSGYVYYAESIAISKKA